MRTRGMFLCMCLMISTGCSSAIKLGYRSSGADPVPGAESRSSERMSMVEIVDIGGRLEEKHLRRLRLSIREHAERSGFADENTWYAPAPRDPKQLGQVLDEARARGSETAMFLQLGSVRASNGAAKVVTVVNAMGPLSGLLPDVIVYSLPINTEHAELCVRAYLVDTETGEVLSTIEERSVLHDEKTTAWGLNAKRELKALMFETMQKVFEKAAHIIETGEYSGVGEASISALLFNPIDM